VPNKSRMTIDDVPSPIDFRSMAEAVEWERTSAVKRPWRGRIFAAFARAVADVSQAHRILELGSGPGFLAEHLLRDFPHLSYVAVDFSGAMHELASRRLRKWTDQVMFVEKNFKVPGWTSGLGTFDCVVTLQSVHELRHKRHAQVLHAEVRRALADSGAYLVCDHFVGEGGMSNTELFMTAEEQEAALRQAGFETVERLLTLGSVVMFRACRLAGSRPGEAVP